MGASSKIFNTFAVLKILYENGLFMFRFAVEEKLKV
jgi:hypothetical protein